MNSRIGVKDVPRDDALVFWLMRLRAESEKQNLRAQARSFCAFVDKCPYVRHIECTKCFDYYLRVESMSKVFAR